MSEPLLVTNSQWDPWMLFDDIDAAFARLERGEIAQPRDHMLELWPNGLPWGTHNWHGTLEIKTVWSEARLRPVL